MTPTEIDCLAWIYYEADDYLRLHETPGYKDEFWIMLRTLLVPNAPIKDDK